MFRDDCQKARCNRALLARVNLADLWTDAGPSDRACTLLDCKGGGLSHGQAVLLRVTFDLWNGRGGATVGELFDVLDAGNLAAVGRLLAAVGQGAASVDAWIAQADVDRTTADRLGRGA